MPSGRYGGSLRHGEDDLAVLEIDQQPIAIAALAWGGWVEGVDATVTVTDPDDGSPFLTLFRPDPTQFDETGLSGIEYQISSLTGVFRANDQYMISGQETDEATSIGNELGNVIDLSGTAATVAELVAAPDAAALARAEGPVIGSLEEG